MHEYYSIGELTREFGITTRTLRYYEDEGLLVPLRRGRTRLYTQLDRNKLSQILRARRLNFSLSEISNLLIISDGALEDEKKVQSLLSNIDEKREELKRMRRDIDDALRELDRMDETCFERLAELGVNR